MKDREFLIWLRDRLICVYGESPNIDYVLKLTSIINATDPEQLTPNTSWIVQEYDPLTEIDNEVFGLGQDG